MAKKQTLAETKAATAAMNQAQFVNYDLTPDDKTAFKDWFHENLADVWDFVDKLLDGGYHVSIKWDTYNSCYGAFLICKSQTSPNRGCILTGRGKTSLSALMGALYRHYVIFEEAWDTDGYTRAGTDD